MRTAYRVLVGLGAALLLVGAAFCGGSLVAGCRKRPALAPLVRTVDAWLGYDPRNDDPDYPGQEGD